MDPVTTTIGGWLLGKVADKGFESITKSLTADDIDKSIHKSISAISKKMQEKYPDVLANNIEYFFRKDEVVEELVKLTFKDARINIKAIEDKFDISTLPDGFVLEFVTGLREEMSNDRHLNSILANSEIYLAVTGLKKDVESIVQDSYLTRANIVKIKNILEDKINYNFSFDEFVSTYSRNALNILSEVNFIGLGVKSHIKKIEKSYKRYL
ncbi:hypothetical protein HER32_12255 [Hymenobacter sp. BT18]|uniref:hypothetical protein n=1 Tax=Hymenobacter sp. BT18 TaxID=2835648 RepID=UPI00143E9F86|nr:hypothetical protein [Hymenobacter sp. BT18]QIX61913.1 hypothetical protein HER32_12255 [Hymenobacter sp. BT18]